jgi:opacity protein-like surface antigen
MKIFATIAECVALRSLLVAFGVLVIVSSILIEKSFAQTPPTSLSPFENWQFRAGAYVFALSVDGDAGIGNIDSDIDVSFGDILDNLDIGGMGFFAGRNEDWSFALDGAYLKVSDDKSASRSRSILTLTADLEFEIEQVVVGGYLGRKLIDGKFEDHPYRIDLLGGVRYNSISVEVDARASLLGATATAQRERSVDWVDPVIAIRGEIWPTETVRVFGWFDYGGFGVGADKTWQVFAGASYHPTPKIELIGGYRVFAFDYEEGSGNDRIKLDLTYSGPVIGIAYKF